eukprot:Gb_29060 [translate_table: standard]
MHFIFASTWASASTLDTCPRLEQVYGLPLIDLSISNVPKEHLLLQSVRIPSLFSTSNKFLSQLIQLLSFATILYGRRTASAKELSMFLLVLSTQGLQLIAYLCVTKIMENIPPSCPSRILQQPCFSKKAGGHRGTSKLTAFFK